MAIIGPGVVSYCIANIIPVTAEKNPKSDDIMRTTCNLLDSSSAVDAGVINIATTRIIPTALSEATITKDKMSIKK